MYDKYFKIDEYELDISDNDMYRIISDEILGISNNFYLKYQAKYSKNRVFLGFEALLRYKNNDGAYIKIEKLIRFAEKSDLINLLDLYVISNVLKQKKTWELEGYNFSLSINTTASIYNFNDLEKIKNIFEKFNINYSEIEFELTERVPILNLDETLDVMKYFNNLGIKIILDDCGIDQHIKINDILENLFISGIKLDKYFVFNRINPSNFIKEAKEIYGNSIQIISEGIESQEDLDYILEVSDIDIFQGNFFGRALNLYDSNELLKSLKF